MRVNFKKGEPFQTANYTYCLKLPLHTFVAFPSGDMNIEIPIKGPGVKELKGFITNTMDEWGISSTFAVPNHLNDAMLLWEIAKSIVSVGLLKQIGKQRIEVADLDPRPFSSVTK